ncbi:MAG TPA: LamG domain-containing protein [Desulfuromonadales bacterium]|nr:LamG domain-containing protein [Desulfuromonadales bacterium]
MSNKMTRTVRAGLVGALLFGGAAVVQAAQSFDLAKDFAIKKNPNGPWSYGYSATRGSAFKLFNTTFDQMIYGGHMIAWQLPYGDPTFAGAEQPIVKALEAIDQHWSVFTPTGTVTMHPGPAGDNSVIRWTAPETATYKIDGAFTGRDINGTTTDVAVLSGNVQIFSENVFGFNNPYPFTATMPVHKGQTVDFTVGYGGNGYICDSTGIAATITKISGKVCLPPTGQIAWWPGDGSAADITGGNNGTPNGVSYAAGVAGQAFSFNGTSNVTVPDSELFTFGIKPFTMDLWVNFNELQGRDPFIAHDDGGGYYNKWIFWYDALATDYGHNTDVAGPALRLHVNGDGGNVDPISYPWNPTPGKWYHVALTRSGNDFTLYIDGAAVKKTNVSVSLPNPTSPLTIGSAEAYNLNGLVDEVEMYNRALSAKEIKSLYLDGKNGRCKK